MKYFRLILLILIIIFGVLGCNIIINEALEPNVNIYKLIPTIVDTIYDRVEIRNYSGENELCIVVKENPGSSNSILPSNGDRLKIEITSSYGDRELLLLNSSDPFIMRSADFGKFYFKRFSPELSQNPIKNNDKCEIHINKDTLFFKYKSCLWPYYEVCDTLVYSP